MCPKAAVSVACDSNERWRFDQRVCPAWRRAGLHTEIDLRLLSEPSVQEVSVPAVEPPL